MFALLIFFIVSFNWHLDDLIVDPRNFEWMREANCPVVSELSI